MAENNGQYFDNQAPMTPQKKQKDALPKANSSSFMGDYASETERYQKYWNSVDTGNRRFPPQKAVIVPPEQQPLSPEEVKKLEFMAEAIKYKLTCGTWFIRREGWLEPSITSVSIDAMTPANAPDVISASFPVWTGLFSTAVTIPDRWLASIISAGVAFVDPTTIPFIAWRITVAGQVIYPGFPGHQLVTQGLVGAFGPLDNPVTLGAPIRVPWLETVQVEGTKVPGAPVGNIAVFARIKGFAFPVRETASDGSFSEYHTI